MNGQVLDTSFVKIMGVGEELVANAFEVKLRGGKNVGAGEGNALE